MKRIDRFLYLLLLLVAPTFLFAQNMQISGAYEHTIALCANGGVYHAGSRSDNQDGTGVWPGGGNNIVLTAIPGVGGSGNLTGIQMVDAGSTKHTIALTNSGDVLAFGNDYACQLGQGSTAYPAFPSPVRGVGGVGNLTGIRYIVGSSESSYAIRASDGALIAWGNNTQGQLGIGTISSMECTPRLVNAPLNSNVIQVDGGDNFTLALLSNGTVYSIGENLNGQLGIGNTTDQSTPQQVLKGPGNPLTNVVSISCGDGSSYAILSDGTLWAWGHNGFGQLGLGNCSTVYTYAVQVTTGAQGHASGFLQNVKQVAGGNAHAVILLNDGTVYTMGADQYGQLGDGIIGGADACSIGLGCKNVPYRVASLSNIIGISDGDFWSFAITSSGSSMSWGQNNRGQLGINNTTNTATPTAMIMGACTILPIELLYFHVIAEENKNIVLWNTIHEKNSLSFEVERSLDGVSFLKIGTIQAQGESFSMKDYSFNDLDIKEIDGKVYYRLKMIDQDLVFQYSSIESIIMNNNIDLSVYPTPIESGNILHLSFQNKNEGNVSIQLLDITGKLINTFQYEAIEGTNTCSLQLPLLTSGLYTMKLILGNEVLNKKIQVR